MTKKDKMRKIAVLIMIGFWAVNSDARVYSTIRGVRQIENMDCYLITYQLWDDNNTALNPKDDILKGTYTTVAGDCEINDIKDSDPDIEKVTIKTLELPATKLADYNNYIEIEVPANFKKINLQLVDVSGRVIKTSKLQNVENVPFKISKANLAPGTYFLHLSSEEGYIHTVRFVKN